MSARLTRLERWELEHLRTLAAQYEQTIEIQTAEIDDLRRQLEYVESVSEQWHDMALDNLNDNQTLGLMQDGRVIAIRVDA